MTTCFLAQLSTLFSLWPFIARQELCQTSQLTFLHPLHAFPLHLLPPSPPVVGFQFPTRCQVSACKGHQTLNLILPYRWPLGFHSFHRTLSVYLTLFFNGLLPWFRWCRGLNNLSLPFSLLSHPSEVFFLVLFSSNICTYYLILNICPSDLFSMKFTALESSHSLSCNCILSNVASMFLNPKICGCAHADTAASSLTLQC